jgi:hypothetical protein
MKWYRHTSPDHFVLWPSNLTPPRYPELTMLSHGCRERGLLVERVCVVGELLAGIVIEAVGTALVVLLTGLVRRWLGRTFPAAA